MISVTTEVPDFKAWLGERRSVAERAVQAGVAGAALGLKLDLRRAIASAGLGTRLGNAVRDRVYPVRKASLGAAGLVYPSSRSAELVLATFAHGATIRPKEGRMLAIPTPNVPMTTGRDSRGVSRRPMTPVEVEAEFNADLVTLPSRSGRGAAILAIPAVAANSGKGFRRASKRRLKGNRRIGRREAQLVPMFVLVPVVRLRKRFDAESIARKWAGQIPGLIERALPGEV